MKHTMKPTAWIAVIIVLLAVTLPMSAWSRENKKIQITSSEIRLPVSKVDNGKAQFFEYDSGGTTIEFFVLKSFDGVIRAAFNACDVCFESKKGYSQKGDFMVCNSCGQPFRSDSINEVRGGCNPSPLDRTITEDFVTIQITDIEKGRIYFQ